MEVVLIRLAEFQEKAQKIRGKVKSAMIYPTVVLFMAVAILTFLMIFIIPEFKSSTIMKVGNTAGVDEVIDGV